MYDYEKLGNTSGREFLTRRVQHCQVSAQMMYFKEDQFFRTT